MVIGALDDLSGLLVEFVADSNTMGFTESAIDTWSSVAGLDGMTLTPFGDGDGAPSLAPNAFGAGHPGVYFRAGRMSATVNWSFADMTAAWVGNLDFPNLGDHWAPHWLGLAHVAEGASDWNTPNGWIVGCYDALYAVHGFVSDRNWVRPIDLYFDPAQNYVAVARKQAGTISGWLQPFGGAVITGSGATDNVGMTVDTLNLGGAIEYQGGLYGAIGRAGLWNRALTDAEVLAVINYLGGLYD